MANKETPTISRDEVMGKLFFVAAPVAEYGNLLTMRGAMSPASTLNLIWSVETLIQSRQPLVMESVRRPVVGDEMWLEPEVLTELQFRKIDVEVNPGLKITGKRKNGVAFTLLVEGEEAVMSIFNEKGGLDRVCFKAKTGNPRLDENDVEQVYMIRMRDKI